MSFWVWFFDRCQSWVFTVWLKGYFYYSVRFYFFKLRTIFSELNSFHLLLLFCVFYCQYILCYGRHAYWACGFSSHLKRSFCSLTCMTVSILGRFFSCVNGPLDDTWLVLVRWDDGNRSRWNTKHKIMRLKFWVWNCSWVGLYLFAKTIIIQRDLKN